LDKIQFQNIARKNGLILEDRIYDRLLTFITLLLEWNQKINLISRKDAENIWTRHVLGSISILFRFKFSKGARIIDIGTGGGFPGIPLAICLPDVSFTLVDSIQKKIMVVSDIIQRMDLPNATALCQRAEELSAKPEYAKRFDHVTARAVAPMDEIVQWTKPFLGVRSTGSGQSTTPMIARGSIVMFKGGDLSDEIQRCQIKRKPASIEVFPLSIEGVEQEEFSDKKLVIIKP